VPSEITQTLVEIAESRSHAGDLSKRTFAPAAICSDVTRPSVHRGKAKHFIKVNAFLALSDAARSKFPVPGLQARDGLARESPARNVLTGMLVCISTIWNAG